MLETPPLTRGRRRDGCSPRRRPAKHPRLRGEDRHVVHGNGRRYGNTPAYAGKTMALPPCHCLFQETPPLTRGRPLEFQSILLIRRKHPRLRGEDPVTQCVELPLKETPPLTRGRLYAQGTATDDEGNTPAYAGKTHIGENT